MNDLQVISLTRNKLKEALEQNLYWKNDSGFVPFSKSKAKWLLKNERIENDDICAILGFENNTLIAFVYLIPDWINTEKGVCKFYWSSRWWVDDKYKNTILSTYTKKISLESVKNQMIIKYLVPETEEYYKKQPFTKFSTRERYIILFDLNHNFVVGKVKFLKILLPLLKIFTKISHYLISLINIRKINTSELFYEYLTTIDSDTWDFIKKYCQNDLVQKTKSYINWQIDNNQYTIAKTESKFPQKCLISSISSNIYNLNFLILKGANKIGFVSALIRRNEFVLRYFLTDEKNYDDCINALMDNFIKSKCSILIIEDEILGKHIHHKFLKVYSNKRKIFSLAHNDVAINFENKNIKQQDGHFA